VRFFGHFVPASFAFAVLDLVSSVLTKKLTTKNVYEMSCFVLSGTYNLSLMDVVCVRVDTVRYRA